MGFRLHGQGQAEVGKEKQRATLGVLRPTAACRAGVMARAFVVIAVSAAESLWPSRIALSFPRLFVIPAFLGHFPAFLCYSHASLSFPRRRESILGFK
jgi:hypothetical protein